MQDCSIKSQCLKVAIIICIKNIDICYLIQWSFYPYLRKINIQ